MRESTFVTIISLFLPFNIMTWRILDLRLQGMAACMWIAILENQKKELSTKVKHDVTSRGYFQLFIGLVNQDYIEGPIVYLDCLRKQRLVVPDQEGVCLPIKNLIERPALLALFTQSSRQKYIKRLALSATQNSEYKVYSSTCPCQ